MAWTTPYTYTTGQTLSAANLNTYLRDNMLAVVPAGAVMYYASSATVPSGYTEYTAARGRLIVGLPSGGTLAGTVGTALTNLQDKTHTHTVPFNGWSRSGDGNAGELIIKDDASGAPAATKAATAANTSGATAGSSAGLVYIQLLAIQKV